MGGQKGIASFYSVLSRLIPVTLVSVKNNLYNNEISGEFLPIMSSSKIRYINPLLFFTFKKILTSRKSTHLIIEHPYYGWLGMLLKKFLNTRLVVHSHNIESLRFRSTGKWWWRILWQYEKLTHRNADLNFFITDEDRFFAVKYFKLDEKKCRTITYGFDLSKAPSEIEKSEARAKLTERYSLRQNTKIILFNGTLDYPPNLDALKNIMYKINPVLKNSTGFDYTILICGKNLPAEFNGLKNEVKNNILYAGFVDDITVFFKGADMFINPVTDGGGIKTKLVEALGYNLPCVSTENGAIGVPLSVTNNRMKVIHNDDWKAFAEAVVNWNPGNSIDTDFYEYFYWGNIAKKAADAL